MRAAVVCRAEQRLWRSGCAWGVPGAALGVLVCVLFAQSTEAGKCVRPPKGSTAFCEVGHQVYVSSDTMQNDTAYWCVHLPALLLTVETQPDCRWSWRWPCCPSSCAGIIPRRFQLDKQAEDLTEEWNENMGCSKRYAHRGGVQASGTSAHAAGGASKLIMR